MTPLIPGEKEVPVSPRLTNLVGIHEAMFLARVHQDGGGGWLARSTGEWAEVLSVSYCTVRRIVETLRCKQILACRRSCPNAYRVDYERLEQFVAGRR